MIYSFDQVIDRRGTDSIKYDFALKMGRPENILPLWVADMDFKAPPEALSGWYSSRFDWKIYPDWLVKTPSVVFAICTAVRALTNEGDAVLIQQPVYHPFSESILANGRRLVVNELVYDRGKYAIDLNDFENKVIQNDVKLFILCSPHNPVGRVWAGDELTAMGELCVKHGVTVVSDEIHADFVYPGHRHTVFAGIKSAFSDITVTCTAPTKTFNLAGLQISNIFIPNRVIRQRFRRELNKTGCNQPNVMGLVACRAAYQHGARWLDELKSYLTLNLEFVRSFLADNLPQIRLVEPEGTYLLWLDCRALGLPDRELDDLIVHRAGLWLDAGPMFGAGGEGFQRLNIACSRAVLQKALTRLNAAVKEIVG